MDDIEHGSSLYLETTISKDEMWSIVEGIASDASLAFGLFVDLSKNFSYDKEHQQVFVGEHDFISCSPYMLGVASYAASRLSEDEVVVRTSNIVRHLRALGVTVVVASHLEDRVEERAAIAS